MNTQPTIKDLKFLKTTSTLLITGLFAISIAISLFSFKQFGYAQNQPYMRVSRSAALVLSTTWQTIDFNGTSTANQNSFPLDPMGSGNPLVYWDPTNKIFKFYNTVDVNYFMYLTGDVSATLLTTPVTVQFRFVIPNGGGAGVDSYFPNPDGLKYGDLGPASYIAQRPFDHVLPANIKQIVRTNGYYVQFRLSNGTLGTVTLNTCNLNISSTDAIN